MMMITMYQRNMLFYVLPGEMWNLIAIYQGNMQRSSCRGTVASKSEDDLPGFFDYEGTQPIEPVAKPMRARLLGELGVALFADALPLWCRSCGCMEKIAYNTSC
jgi:hypothetical protein